MSILTHGALKEAKNIGKIVFMIIRAAMMIVPN